jgi:hypothetical protein
MYGTNCSLSVLLAAVMLTHNDVIPQLLLILLHAPGTIATIAAILHQTAPPPLSILLAAFICLPVCNVSVLTVSGTPKPACGECRFRTALFRRHPSQTLTAIYIALRSKCVCVCVCVCVCTCTCVCACACVCMYVLCVRVRVCM